MVNWIEIAKKYISQGLSVIPLGANKTPVIKAWKPFQGKSMSEAQIVRYFAQDTAGMGLVCGAVSGNLETIDLDCKYDLTGTLYEDFSARVGSEILSKMVIQTTMNGGYHLIYRCSKIEKNQKLAEREATEQEKESGEKIKVLLETRGEGGYIAVAPTKGYQLIQKHFHQISEITEDEREKLLNHAREFNQFFKEDKIVFYPNPATGESRPLDKYNEQADVSGLLVKHGWKITADNGDEILFRRPGKQEGHSAKYTRSKKWFVVYSSSTEFDQLKAYLPYAVYAVLECNGNFKEAASRLKTDGYGEIQNSPMTKTTHIQQNIVDYLSSENEDMAYLKLAQAGKIPMGLSTGLKKLDEHYRFKQGNFVVVNGHDNTGKTLAMLFLAVMSARKHEWSWIIYGGENSSSYLKRKIIELYFCKPITSLNDDEIALGYVWVKNHFTLIANNEIYTYKNILTIGSQLFEEKEYQGFLIDPYNSLYIEMDSYSKLSTHDYHYLATSEFRLFCKKYNCSIYLNCHAVTEALRRTFPKGHKYEGYPMPPGKADTEGGGKFANRADDFITIHRLVQHENDWMWTEFHVRKIKETETGGHPTPLDIPVKIRIVRGNCGFEDETGYNPALDNYASVEITETGLRINPNKPEKNDDKDYPF